MEATLPTARMTAMPPLRLVGVLREQRRGSELAERGLDRCDRPRGRCRVQHRDCAPRVSVCPLQRLLPTLKKNAGARASLRARCAPRRRRDGDQLSHCATHTAIRYSRTAVYGGTAGAGGRWRAMGNPQTDE